MKKPHVLNRPMFNQGGNSAYGKGITSNLVSDEQRQRFNYGGRVGYQNRGLVNPYLNEQDWYNYDKKPWETIERTIPIKSDLYSTASSQTNDDVMNEWGPLVEGVEVEDLFPSLGSGKKQVKKDKTAQERFESAQERFYPQEILEAEVKEKIPPPPPDLKPDPYSDRIDIMEELRDIYKPTEEDIKARQTGRAFKAMGTLGKLAFTPWKTKAFGEALGAEGESWAKEAEKDIEDKKTMKILMGQAVGKRVGAEEKGRQTRFTALEKTKTGNPWTDFQAGVLALKDTDDAIEFATGETVINLTIDEETKQPEMPIDAQPGKIFKHPTTKQYYAIDKDGKPQPINLNKYLKNLKLA